MLLLDRSAACGIWTRRKPACRCGPLKRLIAPNGTLPLGAQLLLTLFGTVLTPHLATRIVTFRGRSGMTRVAPEQPDERQPDPQSDKGYTQCHINLSSLGPTRRRWSSRNVPQAAPPQAAPSAPTGSVRCGPMLTCSCLPPKPLAGASRRTGRVLPTHHPICGCFFQRKHCASGSIKGCNFYLNRRVFLHRPKMRSFHLRASSPDAADRPTTARRSNSFR